MTEKEFWIKQIARLFLLIGFIATLIVSCSTFCYVRGAEIEAKSIDAKVEVHKFWSETAFSCVNSIFN